MRSIKPAVIALGLLLTVVADAAAHHTFIMPQKFRVSKGDPVIIGFHSADTFPESTEVIPRLENTLVYGPEGPVAIAGVRTQGKRLVATILVTSSGHIVITAVVPTATATMKAAGFNKYLREEGLTDVIEARKKAGETDKPAKERFSAYAKAILLSDAPNDLYQGIVGFPLRWFLKRIRIDSPPESRCRCACSSEEARRRISRSERSPSAGRSSAWGKRMPTAGSTCRSRQASGGCTPFTWSAPPSPTPTGRVSGRR